MGIVPDYDDDSREKCVILTAFGTRLDTCPAPCAMLPHVPAILPSLARCMGGDAGTGQGAGEGPIGICGNGGRGEGSKSLE